MALNFGVEVEESVQAVLQLGLNAFAAAFKHMHCYLSFVTIFEGNCCGLNAFDLIGGQQTHSVDQD